MTSQACLHLGRIDGVAEPAPGGGDALERSRANSRAICSTSQKRGAKSADRALLRGSAFQDEGSVFNRTANSHPIANKVASAIPPALLGRGHTHVKEATIEVSFQPPHTASPMIRRTKRLAVNSSRPGCAVGGKSKPSSNSRGADARIASIENCDAFSARKARVSMWAMRSSRQITPRSTLAAPEGSPLLTKSAK